MPAQKRSQEATEEEEEESMQSNLKGDEETVEYDEDDDYDSEDCHSSSGGGVPASQDEYIMVKLAEIRKEVQCPICLGIIRKTRTVMDCLHRFCRECIDKSMRMGNNECPACRTHCASRRSLRDDPKYDALIAALYPDIDKYEEEELAFHEEERTRNQQIQASISQTFRRQSEALGKKRTTARATAAAFVRRSPGNYRNLRGKRNYRAVDQGSDDEEDVNGHDGPKDLSSGDERGPEVTPKRCRRWSGARFSQPCLAAASTDGGSQEYDAEVNRESTGASAGLVGSSEMLAWGKGGMRSHNRHGGLSGSNGKHARNGRISKLKDSLQNLVEDDDELDFNLMLVSLDEQRIPSLQQPYLCCRPNLSVRHLCQYVAIQTSKQADDVEILLVKELDSEVNSLTHGSDSILKTSLIDLCKDKVNVLEEHETLVGVQAMCNYSRHDLLLAYRQKLGCVNSTG